MAVPVMAIAQIVSVIGRMFGGLFQHKTEEQQRSESFREEIAPILAAKARETGSPVFCFWYGDLFGVDPNGAIGNAGHADSTDFAVLDPVFQHVAGQTGGNVYFLFTDPREGAAQYKIYGAGGSDILGAMGSTEGGIGTLALVAGGIFLLTRIGG